MHPLAILYNELLPLLPLEGKSIEGLIALLISFYLCLAALAIGPMFGDVPKGNSSSC